jgi:hypothetical protein
MRPIMRAHLVLACNPKVVKDGKLKCFIPGETAPRWTVPARGYGVNGPGWQWYGGDTPPGRYRLGTVFTISPAEMEIYGTYCIDLIDLENQEIGFGRAGISIHAGRTPYTPTLGCIRVSESTLSRVLNTLKWARMQSEFTPKDWKLYRNEDDFVDLTMSWRDDV